MKPSGLIRAGMASILTLGFASCIFYYSEIDKKDEIVMADKLYNPAIYKEEVVDVPLQEEVKEVEEVREEVYDNLIHVEKH